MKNKILLFVILGIVAHLSCIGQADLYKTKRNIPSNGNDQWGKIEITPEVYGTNNGKLNTVRVYAKTSDDYAELPYVIDDNTVEQTRKTVDFTMLNESFDDNASYITYKLKEEVMINNIHVKITKDEFDLKMKVEGSQDGQKWYTIVEDYQLIGYAQNGVKFKNTNISLPNSQYGYYRLQIVSGSKTSLQNASISYYEDREIIKKATRLTSFRTEHNDQNKTTTIWGQVPNGLLINEFSVDIATTLPHYRRTSLFLSRDTSESLDQDHVSFRSVANVVITSEQPNDYRLQKERYARHFKLVIYNLGNQPLDVEGITLYSSPKYLTFRKDKAGENFLFYNGSAAPPYYDLAQFTDQIPAEIKISTLGNAQPNELFEKGFEGITNPIWLYAVLGIAVLLMAFFALRMLK